MFGDGVVGDVTGPASMVVGKRVPARAGELNCFRLQTRVQAQVPFANKPWFHHEPCDPLVAGHACVLAQLVNTPMKKVEFWHSTDERRCQADVLCNKML